MKAEDGVNSAPLVTIIGGGLAGCEAAWAAAGMGCRVRLYEMKPRRFSPAHTIPQLAELVCSNSLRSDAPDSAVGLLKEEMRRLGSLLIRVAEECRVPAGKALAVDRQQFAAAVTRQLKAHPAIEIINEEVRELAPDCGLDPTAPTVLATGPLTTEELTASLARFTGRDYLSFYDAIAPIIAVDSLDRTIVYQASRYDDGPGDYLNCPLDEEQYKRFIMALKEAAKVPFKDFEKPKYFEGCLPIEVMVERGDNTPRFGPMKPVGLPDPRTGREPYAVVQLRLENRAATMVNMVGFQTKLTYGEQKRVFSMIPGLEGAEFVRLGSIHRNTFIQAPELLNRYLQFKERPGLLAAGQISGVEGYVESMAMGILAGRNAACLALGLPLTAPPADTAHGALLSHLTNREVKNFQPSNINFGLFPRLDKRLPKKLKGKYRAEIALASLENWLAAEGRPLPL
ncbi:MAG TPA: methylenetetrahydrofolate--tRNA-(uracil(54)-C(5))-methyltransferase (FADH(2)-oxidizing) TrmFO [Desulfobacterales bacterium]|nr:methylenetetrahydrofolate--tRNA-(uracil(54)-C(5))-methyltransferase (FADH(2)-oxidizing) TrmFO [Desulfobacterales bacterium]